ncbi:short-chain dehydrogenase/reductase SDR family protein [Pseudohyphozyma bogoriensis]|nr:short-chain dehydrogenase/reductase SDR family protein [Pseudohyphozyma bogoriensis]
MPASPTVYFISGANRGIGFGLVQSLVARPNTVIYAGARDPSKATALEELSKAHPGVIHIVKLSSTSVEDANSAASLVEATSGKIDVLIANAGIAYDMSPVAQITLESYQEHWEVNAKGPLILFQALYQLLEKGDSPKFVLISTLAGSITTNQPYPLGAYGSSKAAANFILTKINTEHEKLTALALHPGFVKTDMGNTGAKKVGMESAWDEVSDSVGGILARIDEVKKNEIVPFLDFKGDAIPW